MLFNILYQNQEKGENVPYNKDNQVLNGTYFGCDGNGNPTTYNTRALTYDPENRLTSFGTLQTDGWNGDGLRAWKQTGASSTRTYYLYDGTQPVGEYTSTGTLRASNVFGADGLLSRLDPSSPVNSGRTYYSYDQRGAVAQRLFANGNPYQADLYFANGYRSERLLDYSDPWGFGAQSGYVTDLETGIILCTHRFYDPSTGRFLTRDPLGYAGGINLYSYTANNPVNGIDPSGLDDIMINSANRDEIGFTDETTGLSYNVSIPIGVSLDANIRLAQKERRIADQGSALHFLEGSEFIYLNQWFNGHVKGKAAWDYKQYNKRGSNYQKQCSGRDGRSFENLGNFNFGATGAALGFSKSYLLKAAGIAQILAGTSILSFWNSNWDDPNDQANIEAGYQYYLDNYVNSHQSLGWPH